MCEDTVEDINEEQRDLRYKREQDITIVLEWEKKCILSKNI